MPLVVVSVSYLRELVILESRGLVWDQVSAHVETHEASC